MTTKADLVRLLTRIYDNIPPCTCHEDFTCRGLISPYCARHQIFTEAEIHYIRVVLSNTTAETRTEKLP